MPTTKRSIRNPSVAIEYSLLPCLTTSIVKIRDFRNKGDACLKIKF